MSLSRLFPLWAALVTILAYAAPGRRRFNLVANAPSALLAISAPFLAMALLVLLSVRRNDGTLFAPSLTLANYGAALESGLFWIVLGRSVIIAAVVTGVTVALAYPVAYFIASKAGGGRTCSSSSSLCRSGRATC